MSAFVLSEAYLYTTNGLKTDFSHLTKNGIFVAQFGEVDYANRPYRTTRFVATARQVKRDPTGPGADVEHRVSVPLGERAPQRHVLDVATAFEVVPDNAHWRISPSVAQNRGTCPRRVSSARSSSSAVYVGSANNRPSGVAASVTSTAPAASAASSCALGSPT